MISIINKYGVQNISRMFEYKWELLIYESMSKENMEQYRIRIEQNKSSKFLLKHVPTIKYLLFLLLSRRMSSKLHDLSIRYILITKE